MRGELDKHTMGIHKQTEEVKVTVVVLEQPATYQQTEKFLYLEIFLALVEVTSY